MNTGFRVLNTAGIQTRQTDEYVILDFDVVDMRHIENQQHTTEKLLKSVLAELLKIRSFSSANGKIVFKSFNKEKRVNGKSENRKKRLGYETFQKHFATENVNVPATFLNHIVCGNSLEKLRELPDNCVRFTSDSYDNELF